MSLSPSLSSSSWKVIVRGTGCDPLGGREWTKGVGSRGEGRGGPAREGGEWEWGVGCVAKGGMGSSSYLYSRFDSSSFVVTMPRTIGLA